MKIEYSKKYDAKHFTHFSLHGECPIGETLVFFEYWQLITNNHLKSTKDQILDSVHSFIPKSKAKIRIDYNHNEIEFFAPNKYIFPKFYIKFNV